MKITVTVTRAGRATPVLKALQGKLLENAKLATQTVARMLMIEARDLAPHDTGALKASAYMSDEAEVQGGLVVSKFGFGKDSFTHTGPDKKGTIRTRRPFDYAIWVHERITSAGSGGGRFDFMNTAIELKTMEIRFRVKEIMKRT